LGGDYASFGLMDITTAPAARYSRGAIALHWLIAVLIVTNFVLAWVSEDATKEVRSALIGNHKAIGITVLVLTLVRIGWRLTHKPPPLVESLKAWEVALSKVVHVLIYGLMLAIPLAGWAMSSSFTKGGPVNMFGLFGFPALPVAHDKATQGMFGEIHEITATLMLALLALHVGAALKHHMIDKDGTLRRMMPGMK
jgi:cytochrome b561